MGIALKSGKKLLAAVAVLVLLVALPVAARMAWLEFGPPYVYETESPAKEVDRLTKQLEEERAGKEKIMAFLDQHGLGTNTAVLAPVAFFLGMNNSKYA